MTNSDEMQQYILEAGKALEPLVQNVKRVMDNFVTVIGETIIPAMQPIIDALAQVGAIIEQEAQAHGLTVEEYLACMKVIAILEAQKTKAERELFWKQSLLDLRRQIHNKRLTDHDG